MFNSFLSIPRYHCPSPALSKSAQGVGRNRSCWGTLVDEDTSIGQRASIWDRYERMTGQKPADRAAEPGDGPCWPRSAQSTMLPQATDLPIPSRRPDAIRSGAAADPVCATPMNGDSRCKAALQSLLAPPPRDKIWLMVMPRFPHAHDASVSRWRRRAGLLPAALRAAKELAIARLMHLVLTPRKIEAMNRHAALAHDPDTDSGEALSLVAFVIPRVAQRLPWRADCLIRAMAAQRWLRSKGVPTAITIGVQLPGSGAFGAHAWLKHGDRIVIGDDVTDFTPIFTPDPG